MKKIISFLLIVFVITGCSCSFKMDESSPKKKVEEFLNNYQTLSDDVKIQLDNVIDRELTFNDSQKEEYREIMSQHYKDLKYEIKDEVIDGDNATVTVEIEVKDYSKIMQESEIYMQDNQSEFQNDDGIYDISLYNDYRLKKLKEANDKIKYTLNLTLTRVDGKWQMNNLSETDEEKIQGIYNH